MKKNLLYLFILFLLAAIALYMFNRDTRLFPKSEANFKVENIDAVSTIFLSDPKGQSITLNKQDNNKWLVNDSFDVRSDWIGLLLDALEKQDAIQVVPESQHNTVIKKLAGDGVKVEVFEGDKKVNAFFVAKQPGPDNTTLMLNIRADGSNADRPYIVKEGIRNTFLGIRYQTTLDQWRDKRILKTDLNKLESISLDYGFNPEFDFELKMKPSINILNDSATTDKELNLDRVNTYLSFYQKLYCMGFENDYILKDTFVKTFTPIVTITLKEAEQSEQELKVFYRQIHKGTQYVLTVNGEQYDGDTFFGLVNKRDFVLLSKATVEKLLRSHSDFYVSDKKSE